MVGLTMATDFNTTDFIGMMKSFQASDEARHKLFADMLQQYTDLLEEHASLKNDYTSERDIRRNYQKSVDEMQRRLADTHRDLENKSFVLVLIDGDGVIFQDALLSAAANNGGSEAASRLQYAIQEHIASIYNTSNNWPIMVQICLSLDKLAAKLASVGLLRQPQDFRIFAQNFSINQPLFNIIDVGHGKERADHKIKEMLRIFSDNLTCKHIIFAGCHDAGYLLNLEQYKHHADKASRITLLESTPALRGFVYLPNFKRARFDDVFRSLPLPEHVYHPHSEPVAQASVPAPALPLLPALAQPPITLPSQPMPATLRNGSPASAAVNGTPAAASPATTVSSLVPTTNSGGDASWAAVGGSGVAPNENFSIVPKAAPKKKWAYYNENGERLDEVLPLRCQTATQSLEQRMKKGGKNLCNNWHLNKGKCTNGAACYFQHEPKLTAQEMVALRYKSRSLPCKDRYCENVHCYLGHQCSFERDQGACPFPDSCHFRKTHGMNKTRAQRWDEDGHFENLK